MNKSPVLPFKAISEAFLSWIDSAGELTAGLRRRIVSPDIVRLTEDGKWRIRRSDYRYQKF